QAGEFGFVLLSFTVANGVIPSAIADQLLLVVALSMVLTPALFILYDRVIVPRFDEEQEQEFDEITEHSNIVIAGHGRVGGIVARMMRAAGHTPTVIDFSSKQLDMLKKFGIRAYFGDATRPDLLHSAGLAEAKLFVIAIDGKEQITELVKYTTKNYPNVHVVARATDRNHVYDLWAAGCRDIIRESYDSSLRMGRSAFEALGHSSDTAEELKEAFNTMDRRSMLELAEHYDPDIPPLENETYMAKVRERVDVWQQELGAQMDAIVAKAQPKPKPKPKAKAKPVAKAKPAARKTAKQKP
ncbi:MAG: NAD-binding protein, partial [Pseudomonadota bacterium]